jgi:NitT/TauT family transport system permease protein
MNAPASTSVADAPPTAVATVRRTPSRIGRTITSTVWWLASVALFAGLWELTWALGWADPKLLPPPHIFLNDFAAEGKFFGNSTIGETQAAPIVSVATTILATVVRVLAGLGLAFGASLLTGILVTRFRMFGRLTVPMLTLLAPISPIAWLPVAIFLFGIGDPPAVVMVFVGLYFVMTLATISEINRVSSTYLNVARTMGANRRQTLFQVVLPAILPGLLQTLRMNLFGAWLVVLIAEAVGVGSGLGQVILLARNTFNASLVFFSMTLIGATGYLMDMAFRQVQRRVLWWQPAEAGAGR